jgi:hypothetical protein
MILLYLDPGSGSFLIQLLIATIGGLGIAIAVGWTQIKRFLSRKKNTQAGEGQEDEDDEE